MLLANYNNNTGGHSVTGITCKKTDMFIMDKNNYEPNMKSNINNAIEIPCELMKFGWNVAKNEILS